MKESLQGEDISLKITDELKGAQYFKITRIKQFWMTEVKNK